MIKLLIVDDSALMRRQLTQLFQSEGDFDIRQARNGQDAVEQNLSFEPDVVTLDINMPEMDGITALSLMMAQRPVPVIMVSSLTEKGALATFEALNLGAVDYVAKPGGTISLTLDDIRKDMLAKVRKDIRIFSSTMIDDIAGGKACGAFAPFGVGPEGQRADFDIGHCLAFLWGGQVHFATGGRLISTALASCPVSSPNFVPRS